MFHGSVCSESWTTRITARFSPRLNKHNHIRNSISITRFQASKWLYCCCHPLTCRHSTCTCQDHNQLLQFLLKLSGHDDNIKARYQKSSNCAFLSTSGLPEDRCGPLISVRFLLLIKICSPPSLQRARNLQFTISETLKIFENDWA